MSIAIVTDLSPDDLIAILILAMHIEFTVIICRGNVSLKAARLKRYLDVNIIGGYSDDELTIDEFGIKDYVKLDNLMYQYLEFFEGDLIALIDVSDIKPNIIIHRPSETLSCNKITCPKTIRILMKDKYRHLLKYLSIWNKNRYEIMDIKQKLATQLSITTNTPYFEARSTLLALSYLGYQCSDFELAKSLNKYEF